jgi:hypothetical protein
MHRSKGDVCISDIDIFSSDDVVSISTDKACSPMGDRPGGNSEVIYYLII